MFVDTKLKVTECDEDFMSLICVTVVWSLDNTGINASRLIYHRGSTGLKYSAGGAQELD
jgi:hypothetical protein